MYPFHDKIHGIHKDVFLLPLRRWIAREYNQKIGLIVPQVAEKGLTAENEKLKAQIIELNEKMSLLQAENDQLKTKVPTDALCRDMRSSSV